MRILPVLAAGLIVSQAAACQWMGGGEQATAPTGRTQAQMAAEAAQTQQQQPSQVSQALVQRIQNRLETQGFDVGAVDGMWGPGTFTALRNFQRSKGLQASGQIDEQTLVALGLAQTQAQTQPGAERRPAAGRQGAMMMEQERMMRRQVVAASPEMIRDVQRRLQAQGYDVGPVDGIWGNRTAQALRSFQRDADVAATGQLTGETLAELGLTGPQLGEMPRQ